MKGLTRKAQVAHDLHISPYREAIPYTVGEITFVFSSDLYRRKFLQRLQANRAEIENSLSKRFGFRIVANEAADLRLYTQIEKRGFLIQVNGVNVVCQEDLVLAGMRFYQVKE